MHFHQGIPHGITSCLSLAPVVHHKTDTNLEAAKQIARILPYIGKQKTGNDKEDAHNVATEIAGLVQKLGLKSTLSEV